MRGLLIAAAVLLSGCELVDMSESTTGDSVSYHIGQDGSITVLEGSNDENNLVDGTSNLDSEPVTVGDGTALTPAEIEWAKEQNGGQALVTADQLAQILARRVKR